MARVFRSRGIRCLTMPSGVFRYLGVEGKILWRIVQYMRMHLCMPLIDEELNV